ADAVRALDDVDVADGVGVDLADDGVEVESGGEVQGAVGDGQDLTGAVAADARVGGDRVAALHLDAGGRLRPAEPDAGVSRGPAGGFRAVAAALACSRRASGRGTWSGPCGSASQPTARQAGSRRRAGSCAGIRRGGGSLRLSRFRPLDLRLAWFRALN